MKKPTKSGRGTSKTSAPEEPNGRRRSGANTNLTISDIARLAEVSKKTVSRVINHSGLVREETRDKIFSRRRSRRTMS